MTINDQKKGVNACNTLIDILLDDTFEMSGSRRKLLLDELNSLRSDIEEPSLSESLRDLGNATTHAQTLDALKVLCRPTSSFRK